jgi:t-SNARE complex subunit (syntaxin)
MNDKPISGFGLAPIKGEGMISDPDEYEWKCDCAKCEERYRHWKNDFDVQQAALRNEALDRKAENARELELDYAPVWNNLPSNKDVEDAMRIKRLNQLANPPAALDLQAELDATNRQVEILSDALAESRREVDAMVALARADERKDIALLVEQMGIDGFGTLAIAAAIRNRGNT